MTIPIYALTGFLDSGKTTLLNTILNDEELEDIQILLIQFEAGEEDFNCFNTNCEVMYFPKKILEQNPEEISEQVHKYLLEYTIDEIWIEWNGIALFAELQSLFQYPPLYKLCRFKKVIHVADSKSLNGLLGKTGGALPEQIGCCDLAVLRKGVSYKEFNHAKGILRSINPGVKIFDDKQTDNIFRELYKEKANPIYAFLLCILIFIDLCIIFLPTFNLSLSPVNTVINIFLGIILQAVPFLLIGIIISSLIQVFVPRESIEKRFPKKLGLGMLVAVLGGFCLPVCDCASIPIFRSLVRKGVPLSAAVTFMSAAPIINPVAILSTYYAFGGNLYVVAVRVGLGIFSAVLIGLSFAVWPVRNQVLSGTFDGIICSCGCYESDSIVTLKEKFVFFLRHSQAEFFSVGKFLMAGAFIASVFQITIPKIISVENGAGFAISLFVMMSMAFLLSLCSSSDAMVGRSFMSSFPMGAIMGFLVFGPMMDIKNMLMLSSGFSKHFIIKLIAASFTICFLVVFILSPLIIGG